ncbi:MAG: ATP-binding protein [Candidatus Thioglobus sp.]|nr:ATP-binding protein [Candidatus Thioglobus sp.]
MSSQAFTSQRILPTWLWLVVFLASISGTFYMGLNPSLIGEWWWVLASYNGLMSLIAVFYIAINVRRLKQDIDENIIGSRFAWSFIKITPLLVVVPVLSFYLFSFQTIQENVKNSETAFEDFSQNFITHVDGLYQDIQSVRNERYTEQTKRLLTVITSYGDFQKDAETYQEDMQFFLEGLIDKGWACQITLLNSNETVIAKTSDSSDCRSVEDQPLSSLQPRLINEDNNTNVVQVKMSTRYIDRVPTKNYLVVDAIYASDPGLTKFLGKMQKFSQNSKNIKFDLNTSVTQNRFLIDFSSTILLAILSVLMIIFRTMDHLMKPLHGLSLATKEISQGNYGVVVDDNKQNKDMCELIGHFNNMSKQIKSSREGLDTHNLYLETILKYSYGVIGLDKNRKIQLINPVIGGMLGIDSEHNFVGQFCSEITKKYAYLKPLFSMASSQLKQDFGEWSKEVEISLPDRHVLLSCQGAALEVENEILGYVIVIKDISQLNRAQKKAAWGEVAMRMAHEIKNPLTPILLSAQRLRNKFLETLKGKELEIVDKTTNVIIDQVKSMDAMVSAFADYANMPQIERKLLDLNALISQSIDLYHAQDNVTIALDLANDTPKLLLDNNNISRVMINLVKNATESVEKKRDLEIKITTRYLPSQSVVRLTIQDNGDGFDEVVIDRVFEPYVTTKVKGSGLGMAIVRNIIEQHDGQIFAGNVEPHGAIITIDFNYEENNKKE